MSGPAVLWLVGLAELLRVAGAGICCQLRFQPGPGHTALPMLLYAHNLAGARMEDLLGPLKSPGLAQRRLKVMVPSLSG